MGERWAHRVSSGASEAAMERSLEGQRCWVGTGLSLCYGAAGLADEVETQSQEESGALRAWSTAAPGVPALGRPWLRRKPRVAAAARGENCREPPLSLSASPLQGPDMPC